MSKKVTLPEEKKLKIYQDNELEAGMVGSMPINVIKVMASVPEYAETMIASYIRENILLQNNIAALNDHIRKS